MYKRFLPSKSGKIRQKYLQGIVNIISQHYKKRWTGYVTVSAALKENLRLRVAATCMFDGLHHSDVATNADVDVEVWHPRPDGKISTN